jgi:hypothetical protein
VTTNIVQIRTVAAKVEVVRKSPAARRAGSIPASGTNERMRACLERFPSASSIACVTDKALTGIASSELLRFNAVT